jgi:hypothetical protein
MGVSGTVYGSALQNIAAWPALNFIAADATLGNGIGLIRHLNYLVAYYQNGIQFYYDAGNATGSPLAPVSNASWTTGCASAATLRETTDITFFVSKTRQYGRMVSSFEGLALSTVSNPFVERILNRSTLLKASSFNIKTQGHHFYGITLPDQNVTLVYDSVFQDWHLWSSVVNGVEQYFTGVNYLGSSTQDLFQDVNTTNAIAMSPAVYADVTGPINTFIRTPPVTFGSLKQKRIAAMYVLADNIPTTIQLRYSDDDYNTFSTWRSVAMSSVRKMLQRCGMTRRRSWDMLHTDNTPLRLLQLELDIKVMEN